MRKQNYFSPLSRRHFLLGSAAVVGSVSLFASKADPQGVDTAASRGKQRNLLSNACSPEKLRQSLIAQDKYRPFPTIHDRAAWNGLRAETRASLLAAGEKYLRYQWPEMPATIFLEYARMATAPITKTFATRASLLCRLWYLQSASRIKAAFLTTSPTECVWPVPRLEISGPPSNASFLQSARKPIATSLTSI